jgi:phosphate transport system substrate-binding protein
VLTWGELGLTGDWAKRPVVVKGPSPTQGFYSVFKGAVLGGGDYRFEMRPEPVASSIVQAVGAEDAAIGFASEFYATARTRALELSKGGGGPYYAPTAANASDGNYPLGRRLFIYVNRSPGTRLPQQVSDFLRFACSEQGQEIAARDGNFPLDAALASRECLAALDS